MATKPLHILAEPPSDRTDMLRAVDEGLADAKAGRTVAYEKVRRWLLTWGDSKEVPPPKS